MSIMEYSKELYDAVDNIRETFWLDDIPDDVETVMWYAGLSDLFQESSVEEWDKLIYKAQEILGIDMGR